METIINAFNALDPTMKVFWGCAAVSSLIFIIQMLLTIIGMDADLDFDADFDGDTMDLGGGLSLFSIRNIVNFFVGYGWAGVAFGGTITQTWLLQLIAVIVGLAMIYLFFIIQRQTLKLESNGNVTIDSCVGKTCDVYLRIPAERSGSGKIQISLNGSVREFLAITDGPEISSGAKVKVTEVISNDTVLVAGMKSGE